MIHILINQKTQNFENRVRPTQSVNNLILGKIKTYCASIDCYVTVLTLDKQYLVYVVCCCLQLFPREKKVCTSETGQDKTFFMVSLAPAEYS